MNKIKITKFCKKCRIEKPLTEFRKQKASRDGLQYWCKICGNNAAQERYKKKTNKIKKKVKIWQSKNQDKVKSYKQDFYNKNKEIKAQNSKIIQDELNKLKENEHTSQN